MRLSILVPVALCFISICVAPRLAEESFGTERNVVSTTNWNNYLGGVDRAGATRAILEPNLQLAWTYKSHAKPEKAWSGSRTTPIEGHVMLPRVTFDAAPQMIISEGKLYFGSTVDHQLHCMDSLTGTPIWSFYTDGPIRLAPSIAHGNVYFGSDDGVVYCLRANDGTVQWKHRVGPKDDRLLSRGEMISRWPVRTGVLVDGDTAYFGAGVFPHETVYLCAANAHTGEILWKNDRISQADAGRNDLSPQGYLLANDRHLFVPSGRSLPVAVSRASGEIVFQRKYSWRTDAGGVVGGTKALLGDGQIYAGGPHHFLALDENTGDAGAAYIGGRLMVLSEDVAFLLDGTKVFCVDRSEHAAASQKKQQWFLKAREVAKQPDKVAEAVAKMKEYSGVGVIWEVPCELDGAMIATSNLVIVGGKDRVVAMDRTTGATKWESKVDGNAMGLAATDDLLAVSTDEGMVYVYRNDHGATPNRWPTPFESPFPQDEQAPYFAKVAQDILDLSQQRTGYCLVLGSEDGRLAYELAKQSRLMILAVEPDPEKAQRSRLALDRAGIHATRVTIIHHPLKSLPFSNYFANLIVSESQLTKGVVPCQADDVARFLKPCGGKMVLNARPTTANSETRESTDTSSANQFMTQLMQAVDGEVLIGNTWITMTRGKLPGAGEWTHQYGNVANTSFSDDKRVKDGLGVLWYGDPGPSAMINRHEAAGAPLSTNGRMFIQGTDKVMAYDAYNGNFLWEKENPGAVRTGVFNNRETHNLAANDDVLCLAIGDTCQLLDAASGDIRAEYRTPSSPDGIQRAWAFVAVDNKQLFGTSTIREELEEKLRRRGLTVKSQTDAIFAFDIESKEMKWIHRGENILHTTIAIGPDHIFFIDSSITPEQRQELYLRDKGALKELTGEAALKAEEEMKQLDMRKAVALDRRTGAKVWERPIDVTDTTNVSAGGGALTVMYADGTLLLCGANANGHYWKQFLAGEFEKRKLLALDAQTGEPMWTKNANYMNRPTIVEGKVYAEPWAFSLKTGETIKRPHPLTGEDSDWRMSRPGHHCGIVTATPNMMFFRSGFIGYYDIYKDSGTQHFAGQRLGCWVNAIPGNGLVMIPEASAGCVCQFSIASTVVLEPKNESKAWGIYSAVGKTTPVKRIGINLGAPGDRKDDARQDWLGYPRPHSVERLEFVFDIQPQFYDEGGWFSKNPESLGVTSPIPNWILASGARGLKSCTVPLLGEGDSSAKYQVKFYFSVDSEKDLRLPNIKLQGELANGELLRLDTAANGGETVVCLNLSHVVVDRNLAVEFGEWDQKSISLSAIEIFKEE